MPGTPGWVTERQETALQGSPLLHWLVLAYRNGSWSVRPYVTDGDLSDHTAQHARKMAEINHGPVERAVVLGPYYSRQDSLIFEQRIYHDDKFAVALANSAF